MIHAFILLLQISVALHQEKASGIFITIEYPRKTHCENELKMVIGKTRVCISKEPIIQIKELKFISDIQYDPISKVFYIDAGLAPAAIQTLNKIARSLPNSKFALAVDEEVVCIFKVSSETSVSTIRMGEDAALEDLKTIQKTLKKIGF